MVHNLLFDLSFYCNLLILFILLLLLCSWRWNYSINKKDLKKKLHFRRNSNLMWTMRSFSIFWNICVVIMLTSGHYNILIVFNFYLTNWRKIRFFNINVTKNRVFVILAFITNKVENVHRYAVWGKKLNFLRESVCLRPCMKLCLSTLLPETEPIYAPNWNFASLPFDHWNIQSTFLR